MCRLCNEIRGQNSRRINKPKATEKIIRLIAQFSSSLSTLLPSISHPALVRQFSRPMMRVQTHYVPNPINRL